MFQEEEISIITKKDCMAENRALRNLESPSKNGSTDAVFGKPEIGQRFLLLLLFFFFVFFFFFFFFLNIGEETY